MVEASKMKTKNRSVGHSSAQVHTDRRVYFSNRHIITHTPWLYIYGYVSETFHNNLKTQLFSQK